MPLTEEEFRYLHEKLLAVKRILQKMEANLASRELNLQNQIILKQCQPHRTTVYSNAVKVGKDRVNLKGKCFTNKNSLQTHVKTIAARDSPPCDNCNKRGHMSENCWSKFPEKRPQRLKHKMNPRKINKLSQLDSYKNRNGKPRPSCDYCNKLGHVVAQCFKRLKAEKQSTGNANLRSEKPGANQTKKPSERPVRTVDIANELSVPLTSALGNIGSLPRSKSSPQLNIKGTETEIFVVESNFLSGGTTPLAQNLTRKIGRL